MCIRYRKTIFLRLESEFSKVRDHLPSFIIFCSEEIQRTPLLTINCKMLRKNCGSWNFTVDFTGFLEYFPIETAIAFCPGRVNAGGADAPAFKGNTSERLRETLIILFTCHLSDLILRIQSTN
ncbi:uncharacterized protein LOC115333638 isoform X2 [Aquila chrysaetos chrysaetos]|uniref:uncharacterized protein LOC115333638 isoform X2 n=1 Tax=Aquila chrysaetos chrysaetos TaxID=223781 RepID=UPI001B7D3AA2|nr:uncharacterized protein LOC115333638 isoform X2 [Aquila chrysaetos chrysaetos]